METVFLIKQAYLSAALAKIQHHIHQQHIKVEEELLRLVKAKYKHGKGLKSDILRVQAEVAEAHQHLNTHHNHLNNMIYELKGQIGIDIGSEVTLSDTLTPLPWNGPALKSLIDSVIEHHPQIKAAENKILERKAQLKIAKSQYLPQVTGQVSGNLRLPDNKDAGFGNGVVGLLSTSLPLLDRERDHGVHAAKIKLLQAEKEARNVKLQLVKIIAQSWSELSFAESNVELSKAAIEDSEEQLRLMKKRFEVGRALNVEVQDAILTLLQSKLSNAQAIFNHELSKAKLKKAIGEI